MASIYDQQLTELEANQAKETNWLSESKKIQEQAVENEKNAAVSEINRQKEEADKTLQKTKTSAYTDYMKAINPYGINQETNVNQGLSKAGYSETTQASFYNTYQTTVTSAIENTNKIKADYDAQINEAILNANNSLADIAISNYEQQITNMWNAYQTKLNILNNKQSYSSSYSKQSYSSSHSGNSGITLTDNSNVENNLLGNSEEITSAEDYYFTSASGEKYQPRYINNIKLNNPNGLIASKIFGTSDGYSDRYLSKGIGMNNRIWQAGDRYYVWAGKNDGQYIDITDDVNSYLKNGKAVKF